MGIAVSCRCGKSFSVTEKHAGKTLTCPECSGPVPVPGTPVTPPLPSSPGGPTVADASLTPFERAVIAKMDWYAEILQLIALRLGWILFILALPVILSVVYFGLSLTVAAFRS